MRKERGRVTVLTEAEQDEIEDRIGRSPNFDQRRFIFASRVRCLFLAANAIDVGLRCVRKHCFVHHAIVAVGVIGRNVAFIREEEEGFVPRDLLAKRFVWVRQQLIEYFRS